MVSVPRGFHHGKTISAERDIDEFFLTSYFSVPHGVGCLYDCIGQYPSTCGHHNKLQTLCSPFHFQWLQQGFNFFFSWKDVLINFNQFPAFFSLRVLRCPLYSRISRAGQLSSINIVQFCFHYDFSCLVMIQVVSDITHIKRQSERLRGRLGEMTFVFHFLFLSLRSKF